MAEETRNVNSADAVQETEEPAVEKPDPGSDTGETAPEEPDAKKESEPGGGPEAGGESPKEADEGQEKKGIFGRKKDKKDKKDIQIEELTDRLKRQMAEFDNYRKRTEKEKSAMFEVGAKSVVEKMLPVIDNFERGLSTLSEEEMQTPFAQGMDKIYRQLLAGLEELGVKAIEAEGASFNPDFHNAVMHVEDENLGENVVAEVFQKGYMYRDSVVRHSMVKVAN